MYLSRLMLDARSPMVRRDFADCHDLHRTLLRAFPAKNRADAGAREEFAMLHRVDPESRSGLVRVYVQSETEPDWGRLPEGYLADCGSDLENPACKDVGRFFARIETGTLLSFTLRANPTRRVGTTLKSERLAGLAKKNGRRVFVGRPEEQIEWLRRKGLAGGFELLAVRSQPGLADVDVAPGGRVVGERAAQPLTFGGCIFQGRLRVTDRERFLSTLAKGLGSGKAYGFGLLTVAPGKHSATSLAATTGRARLGRG